MKNWMLKHLPTLLGLLFLWAGLYKLLYLGQVTMSLETVGLSYAWAKGLVAATIIAELYLGIILIWRLDLKFGLGAAMALMLRFTAYLWYLSTVADPPKCGCLGLTGMFNSSKHEALFGVFRNCVILWALKLTMDYHFKPGEPQEATATV
jgi:hypothetical protein